MRIGVGSGNPVKRRAVEQALGIATESGPGADPRDAESSLLDGLPDDPETVAVEAVPVPSGVSEQPTGHTETIAGAENRLRPSSTRSPTRTTSRSVSRAASPTSTAQTESFS